MEKNNAPDSESIYFVDTHGLASTVDKREILDRYGLNGASPAVPSLVSAEQRIITRDSEARLINAIPGHFSDSVATMLSIAHKNTFSMLSYENQCSYDAVRSQSSSSLGLQLSRNLYERGLASPRDILDTVVDLQMDSAEILKRTELTKELPGNLRLELAELYETILQYQGQDDISATLRKSVKIKQIDTPLGYGGMEGMIISSKVDFATLCDGAYTATQRTKYVIDVDAMPIKWRSRLRKRVAEVNINGVHEIHDAQEDEYKRHIISSVPDGDLQDHLKAARSHRPPVQHNLESDIRQALFSDMLQLPNPENPDETLQAVTLESPFVYHFATTVYVHRTQARA